MFVNPVIAKVKANNSLTYCYRSCKGQIYKLMRVECRYKKLLLKWVTLFIVTQWKVANCRISWKRGRKENW